MFTVDNKFELNQQVFVVKKEHKTVEKKETCDVCLGEGRITYKGYKMTCPKCNGKKEVVLDSQKMDVYSVDMQPHTITSYRYSVTRNGNSLKYRLDGDKNVPEDMIFATEREAVEACDELNILVAYDEYEKASAEYEKQKEIGGFN